MKNAKNVLQLIVSLIIASGFLYFAFRGKDLSQLWDSLTQIHWIWFIILFFGGILSHYLRAWRWKYLLYPIKENIKVRNAFSAVMIGYLVNNVLPRVGELVRPYAIGKLEHVPKTAVFGTVVLERILDIITFFFILMVVFFFYADSFATLFPTIASLEPLFLIGSIVMLIIFVLMFFKADRFFSLLKKILSILPKKFHARIDSLLDSFISGFAAAKNPTNFFVIAISSILIWSLYIALIYIPFFAYELTNLNFGAAAILMVASSVAVALPTPNGLGTYHSFASYTLTQLFKVNPITALSYALYTHGVGFLATTVVGLYFVVKDKIYIKDVQKSEQ